MCPLQLVMEGITHISNSAKLVVRDTGYTKDEMRHWQIADMAPFNVAVVDGIDFQETKVKSSSKSSPKRNNKRQSSTKKAFQRNIEMIQAILDPQSFYSDGLKKKTFDIVEEHIKGILLKDGKLDEVVGRLGGFKDSQKNYIKEFMIPIEDMMDEQSNLFKFDKIGQLMEKKDQEEEERKKQVEEEYKKEEEHRKRKEEKKRKKCKKEESETSNDDEHERKRHKHKKKKKKKKHQK
jgi:hypothetical protein